MTDDAIRARVTRATETIHNPDEPRHFMRIKPVAGKVRIKFHGRVLAESCRALRVLEVGRDMYNPVFYLPREDVMAQLAVVEKQTYCPLKGYAGYFNLIDGNGDIEASDIAWSYEDVLDFAGLLEDLVAFDASRVVLEEHPPAVEPPAGTRNAAVAGKSAGIDVDGSG